MLPVQNKMEVTSMYYSSGNYEAFARPRKPEGVDRKSAYIIGSGGGPDGSLLSGAGRSDEGERVHVLKRPPARRCLRRPQVRHRLCDEGRP